MNTGNIIIKPDGYTIALYDYANDKELRELFFTKKHNINVTGTSYRNASHWTKVGILNPAQDGEAGWRKFSLTDLIWIGIINELRDYGLGLDSIKKVKDCIYNESEKKPSSLEFHIAQVFLNNHPVTLAVFKDGTADIGVFHAYKASIELHQGFDHHLAINLNLIIDSYAPKDWDTSPLYNITVSVDDKEVTLLNLIRSGKYNEIKVKFSDGKVSLFEAGKNHKPSGNEIKDLKELLTDSKYQEIEIKMQDGKIVHSRNSIKIKP